MSEVYTLQSIPDLDRSTPLYGVIGYPVAHSLSPAMQQAAFDSCDLPARYVRLEIEPDELREGIQQLRQMPFAGWNCTIPHKLELAHLVDNLGESAQILGGVNTVLNRQGALTGFNTDGLGWANAIRDDFGLEIRDLRILILGAGGAGQAIATQAAFENCKNLVLVNRTPRKAEELAESIWTQFQVESRHPGRPRPEAVEWDPDLLEEKLRHVDLVVNATSIGLKQDDPSVLPAEILHPGLHVYDTIYKPTRLMKAARTAGARCSNGLSMLLHQGALSFEIWTGNKAPLQEMKTALLHAANSQNQ